MSRRINIIPSVYSWCILNVLFKIHPEFLDTVDVIEFQFGHLDLRKLFEIVKSVDQAVFLPCHFNSPLKVLCVSSAAVLILLS